jgi:secondary thiamine-phosphate synthase enzyme
MPSGSEEGRAKMIFTEKIELQSEGYFNVILITDKVKEILAKTDIYSGQALVYYQHTTGGVLVGESDTGIVVDWKDMFERIAPTGHDYKHHLCGVDENGHAHCRAAVLPVQVTIPVIGGKLGLGRYQDIIVIDDQTGDATRHVIVQIWGEAE